MGFWDLPSGIILAELEERRTTSISLPIASDFLPIQENNITVSLHSGNLPKGMYLENNYIKGTPFEVSIDTVYTFVIRAVQYGVIEDRTFKIVVSGSDEPVWTTPAGNLPIGENNRYFIIDSEIVDFQLIAFDPDTSAGDTIEYYIQPGDGELPPGLSLTTDGRIVGIVEPVLALEKQAGSGNYDAGLYGSFPFDFGGEVSDNGFDSWFYDTVVFDTEFPSTVPRKLNRYYKFLVSIADATTVVKREFTIYLVGDDFLRADNTIMKVANGVFTADNTHIRTPVWLTPANLGFKRANNYITIFLDVIELDSLVGIITYELLTKNTDGSPCTIPPGLKFDEYNGELAGRVPFQNAVTKDYKFTVRAKRRFPNSTEETIKDKTFYISLLGEIDSNIQWLTESDLGLISTNFVSVLKLNAQTTVPNAILIYNIENGNLPPGLRLSPDGSIVGKVNSYGDNQNPGVTLFDTAQTTLDLNTTTIDRKYEFTVKVRDHVGYSAISRTFYIQIKDPSDKNFSNLYARPLLKESLRLEFKNIINNQDYFNNEYIYRPYDPNFGIQKNLSMLVYAGIETKDPGYYVSAIAKNIKRKKYILGDIKTAEAKTPGTNDIVYEVVYIDVIDLGITERKGVKKIIKVNKNKKITVDQSLYNLDMKSVQIAKSRGIRIKTNLQGMIEIDFDPNFIIEARTGENLTIDVNPLTINGKFIAGNLIPGYNEPFRVKPDPENTIKADYNGISVDGNYPTKRYISSINHVRENIRAIGETEIEFLPLWMRTAQGNNVEYIGYTKAIPLCYCKPGTSKEILSALNRDNISFKKFNFDIDRFVIDSTTGNSNEQYLVFHNYEYNV